MTQRMDNAAFAAIAQRIRDRFPLSGVASKAGVKLHRSGREWKGCCPFHPDKSPSFTVYADDRRFLDAAVTKQAIGTPARC